MQKILKHRTYIRRLKQMQELLKKYFIAKTEEELLIQNKEIKERIARKGLSFNEQTDVNTMVIVKRNMKSFF